MKKKMKNFVSKLHTPDDNKRRVVYYAIAEVVVTKLLERHQNKLYDAESSVPNIRLDIKEVTDTVGELAIIDRVQFEKIMINILTYKTLKHSIGELLSKQWDLKSFEDVLNITKYYSITDIEMINNNFDLYKDAFKETLFVIDNIVTDQTDV